MSESNPKIVTRPIDPKKLNPRTLARAVAEACGRKPEETGTLRLERDLSTAGKINRSMTTKTKEVPSVKNADAPKPSLGPYQYCVEFGTATAATITDNASGRTVRLIGVDADQLGRDLKSADAWNNPDAFARICEPYFGTSKPSDPSSHTPGPWEASCRTTDGAWRVTTSNHTDLVLGRAFVCEANARLIAAAPDLLGALIGFAERMKEMQINGGPFQSEAFMLMKKEFDAASAAIAKATGKEGGAA